VVARKAVVPWRAWVRAMSAIEPRVHHVGAAAAVHMGVDETRQQDRPATLRLGHRAALDRGDVATLDHQRAVHEAGGREDAAFDTHRFHSLRISATKS
jgi:hypothetical protein